MNKTGIRKDQGFQDNIHPCLRCTANITMHFPMIIGIGLGQIAEGIVIRRSGVEAMLVSRRIVERIRSHHGASVKVGGENERIVFNPRHRRQCLWLSTVHQSSKIILRLIKLFGKVSIEIHVVCIGPSQSVVVTLTHP